MTVTPLRFRSQAQRAELELAAHTGNPNPGQAAYTAIQDAQEFAADLRDIDPRRLDGRLELWARHDMPRLKALVFTLAAMVPVDRSADDLLAWTDTLTTTHPEVA